MSKLKVPINLAIKFIISSIVPYKKKFEQLHLFSFIKVLKWSTYFKDDNRDEERIRALWMPAFHERYIPEIIDKADKLHDTHQYLAVYDLLDRARLSKEPNILWRLARALYNLSFQESVNKDIKVTMITEAKMLLQMAFSSGGIENADVHKWMAIILDTHYGLLSLENRVKYSPVVRHHLEKACELNPGDFSAHYMMGKWCYQMSQLSWFQRLIARYFIACEPPRSDFRQAYKYLLHAEEIQPRWMLSNLYLLGSTCIKIGQFFKAKYFLNLVVSLKAQNETEELCTARAKYLIRKLERYDLARNVLFYETLGFDNDFN